MVLTLPPLDVLDPGQNGVAAMGEKPVALLIP
jgi:hypothetical protein